MLTQIHIEALKCFDALSLPLAPLTLLTGFNAAGKSTALQAPLLLAQALRMNSRSPRISLNGPLVQLGTLAEVVNEDGTSGNRRRLTLGAETAKAKLIWHFNSEKRGAARAMDIAALELTDSTRSVRIAGKQLRELVPTSDQTKAIGEAIELLRSLVFISAVREGPQEIFPSPEAAEPVHADVGVRGEFAPWWFAQFLDDEVASERHHAADEGTTLRRQVGAWASDLFPGAEANAQFVERTGLVQLQLRTRITDDWRRPANVGYGLTYAFPILVAGLLAKKGQVLVVDSPEAHLHPRAQSRIGAFLARLAAVGIQVILETHSDHVLNGVRLAVMRKELKPEDSLVHFFANAGYPEASLGVSRAPTVVSAHIDASGGISAWPDGFFDQAEKDLGALAGWGADAAMAR